MDTEAVRRLALSLPEATEEPHFDSASFRIRGRIFATLPADGEHLHVMVDVDESRAVAADGGPAFEELWWGKKLCGVRVHLPSVDEPDLVHDLLEDSWRRRAPKRLGAAYDAKRT